MNDLKFAGRQLREIARRKRASAIPAKIMKKSLAEFPLTL
jgi:hypothetical protein